MSFCNSCGAPIDWAQTAAGKNIPLDQVVDESQLGFWEKLKAAGPPSLRGMLVLLAGVVRPATEEDVHLHRPLRVSHFATCKDAASWRRDR